jgi:hypothetical protein
LDADAGDGFRESGFSKERRLEPRITIGLLTDAAGFPLMVNAFEGNAAETNPKHALKCLDGGNSEGCSGLPEIVRRQRRQAHAFNGHRRPGSSAERIVRSGLVDRLAHNPLG